jgi:hypothetical protein
LISTPNPSRLAHSARHLLRRSGFVKQTLKSFATQVCKRNPEIVFNAGFASVNPETDSGFANTNPENVFNAGFTRSNPETLTGAGTS